MFKKRKKVTEHTHKLMLQELRNRYLIEAKKAIKELNDAMDVKILTVSE